MKFHSIHFKFSVLYVLVLGLILMLFSDILFFSAKYVLYRNLDRGLYAKAKEVAEMIDLYMGSMTPDRAAVMAASRKVIQLEGISKKTHGVRDEVEERLLRIVDKYDLRRDAVTLLDAGGTTVMRSGERFSEALEQFLKSNQTAFIRSPVVGPRFSTIGNNRVIRLPIMLKDRKHYTLQIATSTRDIDRLLREWLVFIAVAISLMIFLASFGGRIFVGQILKPVNQIVSTAEKISHEDLSLRVEAKGADEEIRHLVNAFNDMIKRLEKSFLHIQEFSSHVAHELKTPLAVIRGESEIALRKDRDSGEYRRVLEINLREAQRMVKVIEDMLLMSRLEYESEVYEFKNFDLQDFLKEIHGQSQILASQKEIDVSLKTMEGPILHEGDPVHLRRLFFNLIDNAIKFTPPKGKIEIKVAREKQMTQVSITDNGVGIAPQDLPKIFEKFFHRDKPDLTATPGNGLGLSIALSIARAHQGDIQVRSRQGLGTTFTVILPCSTIPL